MILNGISCYGTLTYNVHILNFSWNLKVVLPGNVKLDMYNVVIKIENKQMAFHTESKICNDVNT